MPSAFFDDFSFDSVVTGKSPGKNLVFNFHVEKLFVGELSLRQFKKPKCTTFANKMVTEPDRQPEC